MKHLYFLKEVIRTVSIDPRCRFNYSSYYILGLLKVSTKIKFDINPFKSMQCFGRKEYHQGITLTDDKNCKKNIYI